MKTNPRYLTKSRFKVGCECPTKLFFTGKKEYGDTKIDNSFLEALAEGGFQVGALAKVYFKDGVDVRTLDISQAIEETSSLLKRDKVTIFEPAIRHEDLLVRVDVLVKNGNNIEIIEVKAKSVDPSEESLFFTKSSLKKGPKKICSEWEPYLLDIAFQTFVVKQAFPNYKVTSELMLADKTAVASVDGLNQRFFLKSEGGRRLEVEVTPGTSREVLGDALLTRIQVDEEVGLLLEQGIEGRTFSDYVSKLAKAYTQDQMVSPVIGSKCKGCEFRISENAKSDGLKSAFEECWKVAAGLKASDFKRPMVFDVWNFRKSAKLIAEGTYFMDEIHEDDVSPKPSDKGAGLSSTERQWIQIKKVTQKDQAPYFDYDGLADEISRFKYPLHFIDFETTMVAIPFHKGRRPYEQMAFQFSHHLVTKDGSIEHKTEYINREQGKFPNFEFVRNLKRALQSDSGTIFRFAAHENTVLCQIHDQLNDSDESDREELMEWIKTITKSTGDRTNPWDGKRSMVDMCELVKKYFYHPLTMGSNSIKKVLPAILNESHYLHKKYSAPIYGSPAGPKSLNFNGWQWIQPDVEGGIKDPYKLLEPVFSDIDLETMDAFVLQNAEDASIADGGAAMTAYARMQFTQMSEAECERITKALLKYCELDTFAMVLIFEYWKNEIEQVQKRVA